MARTTTATRTARTPRSCVAGATRSSHDVRIGARTTDGSARTSARIATAGVPPSWNTTTVSPMT
ncbi:MAG TPA: hypothetical protein VNL94_08685 [Candidatus Binatia bacterium]|nr:hypothetical protein [Candidatus Binatia bacterium]